MEGQQHPFRPRDFEEKVGEPPIAAEKMEERAIETVRTLWFAWHTITYELQRLGLAPRELCDAVNTVAEVKAEAEQDAASREDAQTA